MNIISREHLLEYERDKYKRWYELGVEESRKNNKLKRDLANLKKSYIERFKFVLGLNDNR